MSVRDTKLVVVGIEPAWKNQIMLKFDTGGASSFPLSACPVPAELSDMVKVGDTVNIIEIENDKRHKTTIKLQNGEEIILTEGNIPNNDFY